MFFKINGQRTYTTYYKEKDAYQSYIKKTSDIFYAGGNKTVYVETETSGDIVSQRFQKNCVQAIVMIGLDGAALRSRSAAGTGTQGMAGGGLLSVRTWTAGRRSILQAGVGAVPPTVRSPRRLLPRPS